MSRFLHDLIRIFQLIKPSSGAPDTGTVRHWLNRWAPPKSLANLNLICFIWR